MTHLRCVAGAQRSMSRGVTLPGKFVPGSVTAP